ncbi:hypothetical protein LQW54_009600 [Pestalotiopsis sp. IQ-011]
MADHYVAAHKTPEGPATLFLTARNLAKAKSALGDLAQSPRVTLLELDLESLDSVRSCAKEFLSRSQKLNVLICNTGVMTPPEGRTKDGFETQFGTNHLSHFLLINLLLPTLISSATPTISSRVVILASIAHRFGEVDFDNYNFDGNYNALAAYAASKTANVWCANEIERRYKEKGVHAWSVQPGSVLTDLARHFSDEAKAGVIRDQRQAANILNLGAGTSGHINTVVADLRDMESVADAKDLMNQSRPEIVVFAAGSLFQPYLIDRDAAIRIMKAAVETASVEKYLHISFPSSRRHRAPWWTDEDYLASREETSSYPDIQRAKLEADEFLVRMIKERSLHGISLRPSWLTNSPAAGTVTLGKTPSVSQITRGDVAVVAMEILIRDDVNGWLDVVQGTVPIKEAVDSAAKSQIGVRGCEGLLHDT